MTRITGANQYAICIQWTKIYGVSNFHSLKQFLVAKNQAKCSITIAKRKEDNGQPRLAPWCHFKKGEFKLLVCTDLVRILQNIFNPIFMKVFLQWGVWGFGGVFLFHFHVLFLRTVTKYFHFNESKDLPSQSSGQIYILSKLLFGMQTQSIRISSSEEQRK